MIWWVGCFKQKRLGERNECLLLAGEDTVETQGMQERQRIRKHAKGDEE